MQKLLNLMSYEKRYILFSEEENKMDGLFEWPYRKYKG